MTGQELLKLQQARVFRPAVMDSTINEFVPAADAFKLTDAFLPMKLVDKDLIIDLIQNGAFGRTAPIRLGADHSRVAIPGSSYREHTAGYWREAVQYDEAVLQKAVNPEIPNEKWGVGLQTAALNFLDLRLNNLIEYVTSKLLINDTYSEARYGVNYTYNPNIPAKYSADNASSPPWTSGGVWTNATNATPVADMIGSMNHMMTALGLTPLKGYMSVNTLEKFYNADDTKASVVAAPSLTEMSADRPAVFKTLTGLDIERDNRQYAEETTLTAASAATDTTLEVVNAAEFVAGDVLTLRNTLGEEEEVTIDTGGISGNTITLTAGVGNDYLIGDRVTAYKQFLPDGYVLFSAVANDRVAANNWLSTPSLIKGASWTRPLPGRYTWTHFNEKVPYLLEVGAGIDGGPKVSRCNWFRLKVHA